MDQRVKNIPQAAMAGASAPVAALAVRVKNFNVLGYHDGVDDAKPAVGGKLLSLVPERGKTAYLDFDKLALGIDAIGHKTGNRYFGADPGITAFERTMEA